MDEQPIVLHDTTAAALDRFVQHPAHALLVVGPAGSGKKTLARLLAMRLLGLEDAEAYEKYPYIQLVAIPKDKSSIGIDEVRDLQRFATLKIPGQTGKTRRLLMVHDAHTLTSEAQNALLKLLEEPPLDTVIIMTVSEEDALLSTIRSRSQRLQVHRPSKQALLPYFGASGHDEAAIRQSYMLSGGLPGLQHALLQSSDHPLTQAVEQARTILKADAFSRLCLVDDLSKKRLDCFNVLFVLQHMASAAIEQAAEAAGDPAPTRKRLAQWQRILKAAYQAEQALRANAQAKLALDNLMLTL